METSNTPSISLNFDRVLTVPMRNGNIIPIFMKCFYTVHVLTVPMRNGNRSERNFSGKILFVLTVPMRNGNLILRI